MDTSDLEIDEQTCTVTSCVCEVRIVVPSLRRSTGQSKGYFDLHEDDYDWRRTLEVTNIQEAPQGISAPINNPSILL